MLLQSPVVNSYSFLWTEPREREGEPGGASFPAGGGQTSSCLDEGVSTDRTGSSLHLIHSRSLKSPHISPSLIHTKLKKMPIQSTLSGRGSGPSKAEDTQSDGKSFEQLRLECLQKGVLFEDPDFPATDSSLFFSQSVPVAIEWKRPTVCTDARVKLVSSVIFKRVKTILSSETSGNTSSPSCSIYSINRSNLEPRSVEIPVW